MQKVRSLLESAGEEFKEDEKYYSEEDFAYFLEKKEGAYLWLGASVGEDIDLHTPKFNPDEKAMAQGILLVSMASKRAF